MDQKDYSSTEISREWHRMGSRDCKPPEMEMPCKKKNISSSERTRNGHFSALLFLQLSLPVKEFSSYHEVCVNQGTLGGAVFSVSDAGTQPRGCF